VSFHVLPQPSPNYNQRPPGTIIDMIVLHADASKSLRGSLSWIRDPESKVSYHYLIGRLGNIYECVQPSKRAWHAGKSAYLGRPHCNNHSIGVCFSNDQLGEPFAEAAIEAGIRLCSALILRHPGITPDRITTHAAVALPKGRKADPGHLFPLERFIQRVRDLYET
jgi:N-acetylmuramoyl-L-alanine amidase